MYDTDLGIRVLLGGEARLFAGAAWELTDQTRDYIPPSESFPNNHPVEFPILQPLTAEQLIVLIERVTACLLDPTIEAPQRTALLDATIAAVFQQVTWSVQAEIDWQSMETQAEEVDTSMRAQVAAAARDVYDPGEEEIDPPDPECAVMETWGLVIGRLYGSVLADTDWQFGSVMLDTDPEESHALKEIMGVDRGYFTDIAPEATVEDAAMAWCDLIELITGARPEKWRFGGGLPRPEIETHPPRIDVRSFTGESVSRAGLTEAEKTSEYSIPATLPDVIEAFEANNDEWSTFLDRRCGATVGLPSKTLVYVQAGEDAVGNHERDDRNYLELARRITHWKHYEALPSQSGLDEKSIMREFCNAIESDADRDELLQAVDGKEASPNFESMIERLGLRYEWRIHQDCAIEKFAIQWLESKSIPWSRFGPEEAPF